MKRAQAQLLRELKQKRREPMRYVGTLFRNGRPFVSFARLNYPADDLGRPVEE